MNEVVESLIYSHLVRIFSHVKWPNTRNLALQRTFMNLRAHSRSHPDFFHCTENSQNSVRGPTPKRRWRRGRFQMVESHVGKLELVTPGDVVELVEGMQDLYIMGTVDGFQKVTKIDGLEDMSSLTVSLAGRRRLGVGSVEKKKQSTARGFLLPFPLFGVLPEPDWVALSLEWCVRLSRCLASGVVCARSPRGSRIFFVSISVEGFLPRKLATPP